MTRRSRSPRNRSAAPGWVWMLFGLSLGLVVAVGVYLRLPATSVDRASAERQPAETRPAPAARAAPVPSTAAAAAASPTDERRFDFYEILPQTEVVVPDDSPPATRRSRPAASPGSFLLQTGSFGAAADADRHQASLALLGFESHIQRVTIDDAVFHRVRIGPIDDADAAKRTQRRLREAGIDSLLMQVPK